MNRLYVSTLFTQRNISKFFHAKSNTMQKHKLHKKETGITSFGAPRF
jgi:hypothetical protein